ncbi:hypothetical protein OP10G_0052 [Fimbriimonas ginsengisoli Gsoil 348]|uniref:Uncharacterized protein n=1 Tax=Fimbriimonas ginsengisoli Gsoil 348 TaxID=661478 RepID=A0A068NKU5_FIMGI|nr:hypothetical protein OP10G_0052 [Fimbriimonas ginsengisoli Gsoil 348]
MSPRIAHPTQANGSAAVGKAGAVVATTTLFGANVWAKRPGAGLPLEFPVLGAMMMKKGEVVCRWP